MTMPGSRWSGENTSRPDDAKGCDSDMMPHLQENHTIY
jgi:hypothetical protein